MAFADTRVEIAKYIAGKKWYKYLPLLLLGIYIFIRLLSYNPNHQNALILSPAVSFDFWLHEIAHIATGFLPAILTASAGTFSELLLGAVLVIGAFKTRSYFAVMICSLWFMLACQSAGIYMADARAQALTLVSIGGELSGNTTVIHDWNFVFGKLHLLSYDKLIGMTLRGLGTIVGLIGITFALYLLFRMARTAKSSSSLTAQQNNATPSTTTVRTEPATGVQAAPTKNNNLYPVPTKGAMSVDYSKPTKDNHPVA